jgi:hypothetical protein
MPVRVMNYIAAAMDKQNQRTVGYIQKNYLTFPRQEPPVPMGLRSVSGDYSRSLHSPPATISGDTVDSAIGSPVKKNGFRYPALHEFGGRVHVKGREHKVRLRTDARGNLVRQLGHSHLAMFARNDHQRAVERTGHSRDHDVEYPARAPVQRGIEECLPDYKTGISAAIVDAWNSLNN